MGYGRFLRMWSDIVSPLLLLPLANHHASSICDLIIYSTLDSFVGSHNCERTQYQKRKWLGLPSLRKPILIHPSVMVVSHFCVVCCPPTFFVSSYLLFPFFFLFLISQLSYLPSQFPSFLQSLIFYFFIFHFHVRTRPLLFFWTNPFF